MFGIKIVSKAEWAALKAQANAAMSTVGPFWEQEADKVVAALKQTELGDMVADSIKAISSADLSGKEKFEAVVTEVAPRVLGYVLRGGIPAVVDDVEDVARQLVQSVYNSVMSTKAGGIIAALKKVLGL